MSGVGFEPIEALKCTLLDCCASESKLTPGEDDSAKTSVTSDEGRTSYS